MVPTSLNSMDPNQPASAFPPHVSDEFIVEYVGKLSMTEDLEEGSLPKNLRRHELYELRQVRLEDICFRGEGIYESLVKEYIQQPGDTAPPIVVDGVMLTPWDGFHRLNAALARGEETIWAYVGIRPRPGRQVHHDFPAHRKAWEAGEQLHALLASMVQWRRQHREGWTRPSSEDLLALASRAHPEYMTEQGSSLLGVAMETWKDAPVLFSEGGVAKLVGVLLSRGASPDRNFVTVRDSATTTPFHFALGAHHPAPTLLDPELEWPAPVWEKLRPHVDLSLPKNQIFVGDWLTKAANRPLKGASYELERAVKLAGLDKRLPRPGQAGPKPRF